MSLLKQFYLIFCCSLLYIPLPAQYFFTGEVKDAHGDKLQNGSILVQSTGSSYSTGFYGEFEIISRRAEDSLTISFDGYEPFTMAVNANEYLRITLKKLALPEPAKDGLIRCVYKGTRTENSFIDETGSVSFSDNIGRGSCGIVKRFLDMGFAVPSEAVQVEELLNYFNFSHGDPEGNEVFHCSSTLLSCPWDGSHRLLCLNLAARKVDLQNTPPANLVLLIDVSGSMDLPDKLPLIQSGMRLLIDNLRDNDKVSLITFGGRVNALMEGVPGSDKKKLIKAIEELSPDGSTPGEEGVRMAYQVAQRQLIAGGNNRIVLITDGDISED
jgi:Ca-activated chloride channel family protein